MGISESITNRRSDILSTANRHGAKSIRVFGSVARGEATTESDVDFLVTMEPVRSLFDICAMMTDLSDLFDCKVDVVTESSLHWLLRRRILNEATPL